MLYQTQEYPDVGELETHDVKLTLPEGQIAAGFDVVGFAGTELTVTVTEPHVELPHGPPSALT